ncbi:MAG: flagellin [Deferribacterales bacterium]
MAITVSTNISSIIAQSYVNSTSNNITKNIERLSSGLRINSAADDASGLAISEKLKAQISGLDRASMNAQDGISMLQTAEGGLSTIQDMVQRMRELAVQASNGVYTSSDREEIQKEVDQLKEEIDRVASSTEFNTKNLLNGDATALWSSDSSDVDVVVTGKVAEGNYNLSVSVDAGSNYVYKTDVMTLADGALGAEIYSAIGNTSNVSFVSDLSTITTTSGTGYYTVTIADVDTANTGSASVTASYLQTGSMFSVDGAALTASTNNSGYLEVKFTTEATSGSTTVSASYRFITASSGATTEWDSVDSTSVTGGVAAFSITGLDGSGQVDFNVNINSAGKVQIGDKLLIAVTEDMSGVTADVANSGGGTIKIAGGPTEQAGPTIVFTADSSLTKADDGDSVSDSNGVTVYYASLDEATGNLNLGSMTMNFKELDSADTTTTAGQTLTGVFSLIVHGSGEAATSTTKLKDIALFTTDDGANLFAQTQELTIYGNGTSATIYLEGDDTISDFETKLQNAIVNGLGMGATSSTSDSANDVNNNLVNYVSQATDTSNEALQGTFVIQTAKLGTDSMLSFVGDEDLINALSLATIQKGENSELTVTVTDAHTGETVGSDKVNDYTLKNVIAGVNVEIDSAVGLNISWDDNKKEMVFSEGTAEDIKLHLVDNSTELQIGANEGQTLNVSIAQADTDALGLTDVLMVDQESAQSSISVIDNALSQISSARATIGAQINRLEYTITGLETQSQNLTASNSRIADLDMAAEMADYTTNQILSQAGVAMISQANSQAQLALSLLQ